MQVKLIKNMLESERRRWRRNGWHKTRKKARRPDWRHHGGTPRCKMWIERSSPFHLQEWVSWCSRVVVMAEAIMTSPLASWYPIMQLNWRCFFKSHLTLQRPTTVRVNLVSSLGSQKRIADFLIESKKVLLMKAIRHTMFTIVNLPLDHDRAESASLSSSKRLLSFYLSMISMSGCNQQTWEDIP